MEALSPALYVFEYSLGQRLVLRLKKLSHFVYDHLGFYYFCEIQL